MQSVFLLLGLLTIVAGLPVQYLINQGTEECLYEKVNKGESFTISAFILGGSRLVAQIQVNGPVALPSAESALAILESVNKFKQGEFVVPVTEPIKFAMDADFENFNVMDDDSLNARLEEEEPPKEGGTLAEQQARRAQERRKALEARHREERIKLSQKKKIREEGEPIQKTFKAPEEGWYQFCVLAQTSSVTVELDMRKESDYGGVTTAEEGGHVFTLEEKEVGEDEQLLEKDSAKQEGIKDEDFESTREKLKTLRRLLADIQAKQTQERHRLMVHSATNEHSHSRMVLSSLLETVLFMLVTGFQVFTIRRWFKGAAPILGR